MKKLIAIATLVLALSFPAVSSAFVPLDHFKLQYAPQTANSVTEESVSNKSEGTYNVFGVQLPLVERNVADTNTLHKAHDESDNAKDYITVFGIQVPAGSKV